MSVEISMKQKPMHLVVTRESSCLFMLIPQDEAAKTWLEENTMEESSWFAGALVVDGRYAQEIVQGFLDAGGTAE